MFTTATPLGIAIPSIQHIHNTRKLNINLYIPASEQTNCATVDGSLTIIKNIV